MQKVILLYINLNNNTYKIVYFFKNLLIKFKNLFGFQNLYQY